MWNNSTICDGFAPTFLIALSSSNAVSVFFCLLAAILTCTLKLYKKTVYRLGLYQVLASLVYAGQSVCQIFLLYHHASLTHDKRLLGFCQALAFTVVFSSWMKVCFAAWVTFHLFSFAVYGKNMKRLEPLYVLSSLVVSAAFAVVPLATHIYGLQGSVCWIQSWRENCPATIAVVGVVEQFALTYGPSMAVLLAVSISMVVMMIIVLHRCRRLRAQGGQIPKALQQLLPLAIYPTLFFLFTIPPFVNRLYGTKSNIPRSTSFALSIIGAVSIASWSFFTAVTLIVHIVVSRLHACCKKRSMYSRRRLLDYGGLNSDEATTAKQTSATDDTSRTTFVLPKGSLATTSS